MLYPPSLIYVVDDDPAVLHSTCFLFESAGHRVAAFSSGEALLTAFPGPSPALVLLDQVMPGMDGIEVFARLRDLDARVPLVLITGHPNPSIRTRARAVGLPLVEKPLALEALPGVIAIGRDRSCAGEEQPAAGLRGRGGLRGSAQGATWGDTACAFPAPADRRLTGAAAPGVDLAQSREEGPDAPQIRRSPSPYDLDR